MSIVGRGARGVRLFSVAEDEQVVSVSRVREAVGDEDETGEEGGAVPAAVAASELPEGADAEPEGDADEAPEGESDEEQGA